MTQPATPESLLAFFEELERLTRLAEQEVREMIESSFDFYCPDAELRTAVAGKRKELAACIAEIVRNQIMSHDLILCSGLDGATQLADKAHLTVTDQDGREWPTYVHSLYMGYLADRGLQ